MKWLLVIIILLHGLIHLMGGVNETGLAKVQGLTGKTLFPISGHLHTVLGIGWFLVVAMFVISAAGLIADRQWWKGITAAAVILSQGLVIIWWPDAKWGTIANILITIGILLGRL